MVPGSSQYHYLLWAPNARSFGRCAMCPASLTMFAWGISFIWGNGHKYPSLVPEWGAPTQICPNCAEHGCSAPSLPASRSPSGVAQSPPKAQISSGSLSLPYGYACNDSQAVPSFYYGPPTLAIEARRSRTDAADGRGKEWRGGRPRDRYIWLRYRNLTRFPPATRSPLRPPLYSYKPWYT